MLGLTRVSGLEKSNCNLVTKVIEEGSAPSQFPFSAQLFFSPGCQYDLFLCGGCVGLVVRVLVVVFVTSVLVVLLVVVVIVVLVVVLAVVVALVVVGVTGLTVIVEFGDILLLADLDPM